MSAVPDVLRGRGSHVWDRVVSVSGLRHWAVAVRGYEDDFGRPIWPHHRAYCGARLVASKSTPRRDCERCPAMEAKIG